MKGKLICKDNYPKFWRILAELATQQFSADHMEVPTVKKDFLNNERQVALDNPTPPARCFNIMKDDNIGSHIGFQHYSNRRGSDGTNGIRN